MDYLLITQWVLIFSFFLDQYIKLSLGMGIFLFWPIFSSKFISFSVKFENTNFQQQQPVSQLHFGITLINLINRKIHQLFAWASAATFPDSFCCPFKTFFCILHLDNFLIIFFYFRLLFSKMWICNDIGTYWIVNTKYKIHSLYEAFL